MMKPEAILKAVLAGTTEYRHRANPKRQKMIHIEETWALMWRGSSSYGCGYGQTYCSGGVDFIPIPEGLKIMGGVDVWDTARDRCGPVTPKRLARIIEVVKEELAIGRTGYDIRHALAEEFCKRTIREQEL